MRKFMASLACVALVSQASAATVSITASSINIVGSDILKWESVGLVLSQNPMASVSTLLAGMAPPPPGAPDGNVELFASSENAAFNSIANGGAFDIQPATSIVGSLLSRPIQLSSLNGNDWFTNINTTLHDTSYVNAVTNNTLAQTWFNDFFDFYNFNGVLTTAGVSAGVIAAERVTLFTLLSTVATPRGFQRISDPNVSYVIQDDVTGEVEIGLAGTQDYLKTFILAYVSGSVVLTAPQKASVIAQLTPIDIEASEVVKVTYDGGSPFFLYSFDGQPSGLTTNDPTESYNTNFRLTFQGQIPEPTTAMLMLGTAVTALLRRRR